MEEQHNDQGGQNMNQQPAPEHNVPGPEEGVAEQPPQAGGDSEQGKLWGILGYIISILFFVPLILEETKHSQFSRFHANQQLVLLILWFVGMFLVPLFGLGLLVHLFAFVLMIIGIVNAAGGKMKKLPLIGGITLIK